MSNQSPSGKRRGGVTAAIIIIGIVIVLLIALAVSLWLNRGDPEPPATSDTPIETTEPEPSDEPPDTAPPPVAAGSICGLPGLDPPGRTWNEYMMVLDQSEWVLWGTTMVPQMSDVGPGRVADEGYPYCFAQTIEGAINAAAWFARMPPGLSSREQVQAWLEYAVSAGEYHDQLVAEGLSITNGSGSWGDGRVDLAGFRVLSFGQTEAKVEIAMTGIGSTGQTLGSSVFELVWQDGDWKFNAATRRAMVSADIPSLNGFSSWYVSE